MAATATTILALCALLAGSSSGQQCTIKTLGNTLGPPTPLQIVPLPPPTKTWNIQTRAVETCRPGSAVGVEVKVCDPEGPPPPFIDILTLNEAVIKRNTNAYYSSAQLYVTVYCNPYGVRVGGLGFRRAGGDGGVGDVGEVGETEEVEEVGRVGGVALVPGVRGVRGVEVPV